MNNKLIFLLLFTILFSQDQNIIILDVKVEGNQRLSEQDIIRNARLFKGMAIQGPEIQQAIKRLWKLKRFENIQILVDEETSEGLSLRIIVEEFPILGKLEFDGNKKISKQTLQEEIKLKIGQMLSNNAVFEAIEIIKSLYAEKHFHNVKIDIDYSIGDKDFSKNLKFIISIRNKTKLKKISFIGNNIFSDRKLLNQFSENKPKKWYLPWGGAWKEELFENDKDLLVQFYKNKGYRDCYIKDETINLTKNGRGYIIELNIYEGPQYKIRNISWSGNYIHSNEELLHRLNYSSGDILDENNFNIAISERVSPLYTDKGYFYFQINPIYTPVNKDSLDIHFKIIENQIVHIRKINVSGNEKTHENVILRELMVYPGDIFSRKKLMDSYRDIFMLNYFENVAPDIVRVNDNEIDIQFDVLEKNTGQANLSMGYNGIYGFTGGGGFEFPNFRGKGQTVSISYQRGLNANSNSTSFGNSYQQSYGSQLNNTSYQSFSLSFTEPWLFDTPNLIGGRYFYTERGQESSYLPFDTQQQGGALQFGRRFKWPDHYFRGSWMIRWSNNKYIADDPVDFNTGFTMDNIEIIENNGNYSFSSSGISFTQTITRDSRNHPEFPTSGSKSIWASTISGGILGGNQDYHKHVLDFNYFIPLHNKFTVSQIFKAGMLGKINSKDDEHSIIPPSARFIMGGIGIPYGEMLRGYTENRVGPYGSTRGGNFMLKYSLEFRLSLSANPTIYLLSFFEMGNVWSETDKLDPFDLKRSAGLGVRVFIPMLGMLGYDMGYGFDYTDYDEIYRGRQPHGWEYHLIFGMPF